MVVSWEALWEWHRELKQQGSWRQRTFKHIWLLFIGCLFLHSVLVCPANTLLFMNGFHICEWFSLHVCLREWQKYCLTAHYTTFHITRECNSCAWDRYLSHSFAQAAAAAQAGVSVIQIFVGRIRVSWLYELLLLICNWLGNLFSVILNVTRRM